MTKFITILGLTVSNLDCTFKVQGELNYLMQIPLMRIQLNQNLNFSF